jgi:hypothetical protein
MATPHSLLLLVFKDQGTAPIDHAIAKPQQQELAQPPRAPEDPREVVSSTKQKQPNVTVNRHHPSTLMKWLVMFVPSSSGGGGRRCCCRDRMIAAVSADVFFYARRRFQATTQR